LEDAVHDVEHDDDGRRIQKSLIERPRALAAGRRLPCVPGNTGNRGGVCRTSAGTELGVVVLVRVEVVVDTGPDVVEEWGAVESLGGEDFEPTANPMAVPTPSATSTRAAMPTRTTVLRRTVISRESLFGIDSYGTSQRSRNDEWQIASSR
jgi:hypothetical protein